MNRTPLKPIEVPAVTPDAITKHALIRFSQRHGGGENEFRRLLSRAKRTKRVKGREFHRRDHAVYWRCGCLVVVVVDGIVVTVHRNEKRVCK